MNNRRSWLGAVAVLSFCGAVLAFNLSLAVRASYSRDENLYLAAGALFGQGLLPYWDFHYTHLPYLLPFYALVFRFADSPLLAARFFSAVCATGVAGLAFWAGMRFSARQPGGTRWLLAFGWALLLTANPLYEIASSWCS